MNKQIAENRWLLIGLGTALTVVAGYFGSKDVYAQAFVGRTRMPSTTILKSEAGQPFRYHLVAYRADGSIARSSSDTTDFSNSFREVFDIARRQKIAIDPLSRIYIEEPMAKYDIELKSRVHTTCEVASGNGQAGIGCVPVDERPFGSEVLSVRSGEPDASLFEVPVGLTRSPKISEFLNARAIASGSLLPSKEELEDQDKAAERRIGLVRAGK